MIDCQSVYLQANNLNYLVLISQYDVQNMELLTILCKIKPQQYTLLYYQGQCGNMKWIVRVRKKKKDGCGVGLESNPTYCSE